MCPFSPDTADASPGSNLSRDDKLGRISIIANPVSGRGGVSRALASTCQCLEREGFSVTAFETRAAGDAARLSAEARRTGAEALVVIGGDGTVREAAAGLLRATDEGPDHATPPILVIPTGTENILAKYLGLTAAPDQVARVLREGRTLAIDVGLANGSPFLLVAGAGFDAEVVRRLTAERGGHINYASYIHPLWRTFWSFRQPYLQVDADGATVFRGQGMVFVGNVPRYAVGLRLLHKADPSDGLLDLCIFSCRGRLSLLRHAINVLLRRHVKSRGVTYLQAKSVTVRPAEDVRPGDRLDPPRRAAPVHVEIDGDLAGELPMTFEMARRQLHFFVGFDSADG